MFELLTQSLIVNENLEPLSFIDLNEIPFSN